jgi:hypothetical protein
MLSTARPDASTVWLDRTQAPGSAALALTCMPSLSGPPKKVLQVRGGDLDVRARGRDEVGPHQLRHGDLDGDEDGEGDRHRGERAADQHPDRHTEREGEGRVGDRDDPAGAEQQRLHPRELISGGLVERVRPPVDREADQSRGGDGRQADEAELDGQPARAGDALVPRQPVRAGLELAGDQRRAPEEPD